jgi:hypothetical protein
MSAPTAKLGGMNAAQVASAKARAAELQTELDAVLTVQRMRTDSAAEMELVFFSARRQGKTLLRRELLARVSPMAVRP